MAHVSQLVALEEVHNCRDLGGMPAADGRVIRPHALLRSANLHRASVRDLATLRDMGLEHVLDLRTQQERDAERDRLLVSWSVTKLPIFDEASAFPLQWRGIVEHPGTFIMDLYTVMITSQTAVDQWTRMFQLLLDEPGCYLWHCTQGKDRTGVAAALIEAALGASPDDIRADYLETNKYMSSELPASLKRARKYLAPAVKVDLHQFVTAEPRDFDAMMAAAEPYGGLLGFVQDRLGVDDSKLAQLRDYYTVPVTDCLYS